MGKDFNRFRAHPWHGLPIGDRAPEVVESYIEITPFDVVKYEIDKRTGYLRVDRPQGSSALPPFLYGFIPRTYCGDRVAELTIAANAGDHDPLDICVLSQQRIERADIVISARVLGGIQLVDGGEADDKIIAVLDTDQVFSYAKGLQHIPETVINRMVHYFATYKMDINTGENTIKVMGTYGAEHARKVIQASIEDYQREFKDKDRRSHTDLVH
ncbi:MAG: inorganic pyrophosphatase [Planctomycetes bacterium]|nr:inorganic pyrophosphatase [Planctomycetota bacterium]